MDLFALKKLVSLFLHPLPMLIGAAILGLCLYFFSKTEPKAKNDSAGWARDSMDLKEKIRRRRVRRGWFGIVLVWTSLILLYLLGLGPVSQMLVRPLEGEFPLLDPMAEELQNDPPKFVVVLGAGYSRAQGYPVTSTLGTDSANRFMEGVRLYRQLPGAKLVVTGGDVTEGEDKRKTSADGMAELAELMEVPEEDILIERDARDTSEHPVKILPLIGEERRVIVVTSAMHMRRSMALFRKQGFDPIAAPAGVLPQRGARWEISTLVPTSGSYRRLDAGIHEYLGLMWAKMRGKID